MSTYQLQEWLGHANLNTTQVYVHLAKQSGGKSHGADKFIGQHITALVASLVDNNAILLTISIRYIAKYTAQRKQYVPHCPRDPLSGNGHRSCQLACTRLARRGTVPVTSY